MGLLGIVAAPGRATLLLLLLLAAPGAALRPTPTSRRSHASASARTTTRRRLAAARPAGAPTRVRALRSVTELESLEAFDDAVAEAVGDAVVVVDFATSSCEPCKLLAPQYERASEYYPEYKFFKVVGDTTETQAIMKREDVRSVPAFHFYKNGERRRVLQGAKLTSMDIIDEIEEMRWSS